MVTTEASVTTPCNSTSPSTQSCFPSSLAGATPEGKVATGKSQCLRVWRNLLSNSWHTIGVVPGKRFWNKILELGHLMTGW